MQIFASLHTLQACATHTACQQDPHSDWPSPDGR